MKIRIWPFLPFIPLVLGTYRYYSNVWPYGSGDTMLTTFHGHGGTRVPTRKWNIECMDGEAMVGIHDWVDDFEKLQAAWCKFMFPNKPSSQGRYPYYPTCYQRDFGILGQDFCYVPLNHSLTVNTFITALWDDEFQFWVYRAGGSPGSTVLPFNGDDVQPYKCCKTPDGYYIDYTSCYYQNTHDANWEFYDSVSHIITYCVQDFVMTGISKRRNPWTTEQHIEYIQCCRLGNGPPVFATGPPVTTSSSYSDRPAYSSPRVSTPYVPAAYQRQYRGMEVRIDVTNRTKRHANMEDIDYNENYNVRFAGRGIPKALRGGVQGQAPRTLLGVSGPQSA